jgi:triosephosphate isomerase (TIM)
VYLSSAKALTGKIVKLGAQDCSAHVSGAYTGEVSAAMLAEMGCSHVIVGHSERRQFHAESDELVSKKAQAALASGMTPVICVGESLTEREANRTADVIEVQVRAVLSVLKQGEAVLAYEPVWAIGTGRTASPEQAQEVHRAIRSLLAAELGAEKAEATLILYGGSMKPDNANALLACADIDGGLVGGASLKAQDFLGIAQAA